MSFVLERLVSSPPATANVMLRAESSGLRRRHRQELREWRAWAKGEADDRGWPAITGPVSVEAVHLRPNHASPPDTGACYFQAKAMLDGLVDAGVLPGDGPRFVRSQHFPAYEVVGEHGVRLVVRELELHTSTTTALPIGD